MFFLLLGSFSFASSGKNYFSKALNFYSNGKYIKAAELFKKACDLGDTDGCYNLRVLGTD